MSFSTTCPVRRMPSFTAVSPNQLVPIRPRFETIPQLAQRDATVRELRLSVAEHRFELIRALSDMLAESGWFGETCFRLILRHGFVLALAIMIGMVAMLAATGGALVSALGLSVAEMQQISVARQDTRILQSEFASLASERDQLQSRLDRADESLRQRNYIPSDLQPRLIAMSESLKGLHGWANDLRHNTDFAHVLSMRGNLAHVVSDKKQSARRRDRSSVLASLAHKRSAPPSPVANKQKSRAVAVTPSDKRSAPPSPVANKQKSRAVAVTPSGHDDASAPMLPVDPASVDSPPVAAAKPSPSPQDGRSFVLVEPTDEKKSVDYPTILRNEWGSRMMLFGRDEAYMVPLHGLLTMKTIAALPIQQRRHRIQSRKTLYLPLL